MPAHKGNKYAKGNKGGSGCPDKYKPEYTEQAYKYCLLGATDAKLAELFDVCETTINKWKKEHKEFFEALKKGKDIADAEVADSLYQRAKGYSHNDIDIKVVALGGNQGSEVQEIPIVKHYPPDVTSAIFWLKNRQSKEWRDKQEVALGNDPDNPLTDAMPAEAKKKYLEEINNLEK